MNNVVNPSSTNAATAKERIESKDGVDVFNQIHQKKVALKMEYEQKLDKIRSRRERYIRMGRDLFIVNMETKDACLQIQKWYEIELQKLSF